MKHLMMFIFLYSLTFINVYPQRVAIKTNTAFLASTSMNIGSEVAVNKNQSIDLSVSYNPFTYPENRKLKHILVQPEYRYWFCETFNGNYIGMNLGYASYNVAWKGMGDYRYEGWLGTAGLSYGYQWYIGKRWNLEAGIGFGYARITYEKYWCETCGEYLSRGVVHYVGPTKISVSFSYFLK